MLTEKLISFPELTTERLTLRQLMESDVQEIFFLRSDKLINKFNNRIKCKTLDDALDFIRNTNESIKNNELVYWAITETGKENLIGIICIFSFSEVQNKCEIGFELLPEYQGQGIMNEAIIEIIEYTFQTIGLKRIDAFIHKENLNSIKFVQKYNFVKTDYIDKTNPDLFLFQFVKPK